MEPVPPPEPPRPPEPPHPPHTEQGRPAAGAPAAGEPARRGLKRRLAAALDWFFGPAAPPGASRSAAGWFHAYANWLVGLSWMQFVLLAAVTLVVANLLEELPPFNVGLWTHTEVLPDPPARRTGPPDAPTPPGVPAPPVPPVPPVPAAGTGTEPFVKIETPEPGQPVEITVDRNGVRIGPRRGSGGAASAPGGATRIEAGPGGGVTINVPPGRHSEVVREALEEARREIEEAVREAGAEQREAREQAREQAREEAREEAREGARAARERVRDHAREAVREAQAGARAAAGGERRVRVRTVRLGDFLSNTALIFIFVSAAIKLVYKGRIQAEVKAAQATEVAEAESLRRQVVEARMAAMQAQVEPHFLFNTLASIDHLIETDPPRASQMQKNLIALLRASMPSLREANAQGTRDLGQELAVIRPYLEILKVRMEDRLHTDIQVSEGLQSALFPPMMLQSLVENAIKHGLEPKADGGSLTVRAEVVHGKLAVTVADTGLGFGKAATAGTGTGLANIRERLQLLYGGRAQLRIAANTPTGTVATIAVPYETREVAA